MGLPLALKVCSTSSFWPTTLNNQLNQISMRRIYLKLTIKTPAWPRITLLYNVFYMLPIWLIQCLIHSISLKVPRHCSIKAIVCCNYTDYFNRSTNFCIMSATSHTSNLSPTRTRNLIYYDCWNVAKIHFYI